MSESKGVNWTGWGVLGLLFLLWEVSSRSNPELRVYIPPASEIFQSLFNLFLSRQISSHLVASLNRFFIGYLLAGVVAVGLGIVLGYFRFVYRLSEMVIEFLRPMPSVAIIPVAILALGIGDSMIIAVTVYACAWPILVNTIDGVRNIDRTLINTGKTFGLSRWKILTRIVVPGASPYIVTGLRISLAIALILVTTAEMVVGGKGLGFFILDEERSLRNGNMYAGILLIAILGYLLNRLFLLLERKVMGWQRGMKAREAV
jgi:ABC-type nitrate/sulfonate/bicarbonate transport system permease component